MKKSLTGAMATTLLGCALLAPGIALAGATTPVPQGPKPVCQSADNQLCPGDMDVKAQPPKGYKIPKKPRGYTQ